jgi:hypothetical protein
MAPSYCTQPPATSDTGVEAFGHEALTPVTRKTPPAGVVSTAASRVAPTYEAGTRPGSPQGSTRLLISANAPHEEFFTASSPSQAALGSRRRARDEG